MGQTISTDIGRRRRQPAGNPLPAQAQQFIAGPRLIAGGVEKGEKLRAGDGIFAQRKGLHRHSMLRSFGIETSRLARRAAHQKFTRRNADHLGTFGAFLEFTVWLDLRAQ